MVETNDNLREYLDQTVKVLTEAFAELHAMHRHNYPDCKGGCPAHYVLTRLTEQTIRTQALRTALGYTAPPEEAPEA